MGRGPPGPPSRSATGARAHRVRSARAHDTCDEVFRVWRRATDGGATRDATSGTGARTLPYVPCSPAGTASLPVGSGASSTPRAGRGMHVAGSGCHHTKPNQPTNKQPLRPRTVTTTHSPRRGQAVLVLCFCGATQPNPTQPNTRCAVLSRSPWRPSYCPVLVNASHA